MRARVRVSERFGRKCRQAPPSIVFARCARPNVPLILAQGHARPTGIYLGRLIGHGRSAGGRQRGAPADLILARAQPSPLLGPPGGREGRGRRTELNETELSWRSLIKFLARVESGLQARVWALSTGAVGRIGGAAR